MKLQGKAHKFGNDVNTDYIISGRYKFKIQDPKELARHIMEDLRPNFYKKIRKGDFIVAGENFGCGSSREQAPLAIKYAGVLIVLAKSFARIFFRNSINIGLIPLECNTDKIHDGDSLLISIKDGIVYNKTKDIRISVRPMPRFMLKILKEGGLIAHFKKHRGFKINA